jgi:hypothetical protein
VKKFWLILLLWTFWAPIGFAEEVQVTKKSAVHRATPVKQTVFEYRHLKVPYKPYVSKLCTPSGINILRDAPSDHKHHHGLMLGFTIDGGNFWDEKVKRKPGTQKTTKTEATKDGQLVSTLDWIKFDGKKVATEKRTVTTIPLEEVEATVLDWNSTLSCPNDLKKVNITGRHFFGLGLRFVKSMDNGGRFFFDEKHGKSCVVRGDERVTQAHWAAYTAKVDGKPVTVAIFDSPENPLPMYAFTMGDNSPHFAYLAATLNLYRREPLEFQAGKPLTLRWGVALWDGEATPATVEAAYQAWLQTK